MSADGRGAATPDDEAGMEAAYAVAQAALRLGFERLRELAQGLGAEASRLEEAGSPRAALKVLRSAEQQLVAARKPLAAAAAEVEAKAGALRRRIKARGER